MRTLCIYGANFTALCFGVVIFQVLDDPSYQFFLMVLISQVLGLIMSIIFLYFIRERKLSMDYHDEDEEVRRDSQITLINRDS